MNTIIIGDIHGRKSVVEKVLTEYPNYQRIWVGDLIDSFDASIEDQLWCLETVLDKCEKENDIYIIGNHEASYLFHGQRCGGWNMAMASHIACLRSKILRHAKFYHCITRQLRYPILITHAGLSSVFWEMCNPGLVPTYNNVIKWLDNITNTFNPLLYDDPLFMVGFKRGGISKAGGILWCDIKEFVPIEGFIQVFGHTQVSNITFIKHKEDAQSMGICIDVVYKHQFLYLNDLLIDS